MTVEEYRAAAPGTRLAYRLVRNPLILFVLGPPLMFLIAHRNGKEVPITTAEFMLDRGGREMLVMPDYVLEPTRKETTDA